MGTITKDYATKLQDIEIPRYFTKIGENPYDTVDWHRIDVRVGDFFQANVEAPVTWSERAVGIVAKIYFATVEGKREDSIKTLIDRVVNKITEEGSRYGYFERGRVNFCNELKYIILHQYASFNTPVWLNLGVPGRKQSVSACYLLNVEDRLLGDESIVKWWETEAAIFKTGGGAGVNVSKLRPEGSALSTGGVASGPVSYMRTANAACGTIKSGGTARRGARMVQINVDHPDVLDFIDSKVREDDRMRALQDAGFDLNPATPIGECEIEETTSFQNANHSVRVSDDFMVAVDCDDESNYSFRDGSLFDGTAKDLLMKIAEAAWKCADPGIVFNDTVNSRHTTPVQGRIETSNPCCEVHINNNSACNLASINLAKIVFNIDSYLHVINVMITAMDIMCSFTDQPTQEITDNTRNLRQLGLGYTNLGTALMISGWPYDSDGARESASFWTSLLNAQAYKRSAQLASVLGPFKYWRENKEPMEKVLAIHAKESVGKSSYSIYDEALKLGRVHGFRNSQVTVIAPTGTISFMMDCDTTGCEPAYSLRVEKSLAAGGSMTIVNNSVAEALENLGYDRGEISVAMTSLKQDGSLRGIDEEHKRLFQTAIGDEPISPEGHLSMVAAIQPHISGACSKTINLPESATIQDIFELYLQAWKDGVKCVSVYRDGSKATQVLTTKVKQDDDSSGLSPAESVQKPTDPRKRMLAERQSITHKFSIGGHEGYITAGMYEDGTVGEIFLTGIGKEGSTLRGMMDAWAIAMSIGLQYGVPLETFARKFAHMRFEPEGFTSNADIRTARSMVDYISRWLVGKFGDDSLKEELGLKVIEASENDDIHQTDASPVRISHRACSCGSLMVRTGTCYTCPTCGASGGCG